MSLFAFSVTPKPSRPHERRVTFLRLFLSTTSLSLNFLLSKHTSYSLNKSKRFKVVALNKHEGLFRKRWSLFTFYLRMEDCGCWKSTAVSET